MDIGNMNRRRTTHFLIGSFALLLCISAAAFFCLGYYVSKISKEAIDGVGDLYMTGINEQISSHFHTLMNLKLEQAETVTRVVLSEPGNKEDLYHELIYRVTARNFDYLALCSEEGDLQMLYGNQIRLADPEPFYRSLRDGENKVAVGRDEFDKELVLFGIGAEYPMENEEQSMALVVGLPITYISEMLATEGEDTLMYSHIIRKDGEFVVRSGDAHARIR